MKKLMLILLIALSWYPVHAQEEGATVDSMAQCRKWLSIEHEFVKAKNYKEALPYWEKLHQFCPSLSKAIYLDGVKIYKDLYKKEKDVAKKKEIGRKIVDLYDERLQYFPDPSGKTAQYKAVAMINYKVGTSDELYATLDTIFTKHPENFTHPKAYWGYFNATVEKYKKGKIPLEEVFNKYDDLTDLLNETVERLTKEYEALSAKDENQLTAKEAKKKHILSINLPAMNKVYKSMDATLGELGDCKTLVPFYNKNFSAHKSDTKWLKRAASRLAGKDCTNDPIFTKIVEALHKIEPSATSAKFLAIKYKKAKNYSKAIQYYKNAINLERNPYEKAKLYYSLASIYAKLGNKPKARENALKALKYKSSMGAAYLLIANLYAKSANECGNTRFEKLAIYWKAEELAKKAAQVDPTIRKSALKAAQAYRDRAPSKQEVFLQNMAGKTIKFDKCWVGGSVRVPSN